MKIISLKKKLVGGTNIETMIETYRFNNTPSKNIKIALKQLSPPLEYVRIIGDGNCFFTAIAKTINPNLNDEEAIDKGLEYRNMISTVDINFIRKNLYQKGSISPEEILDEIKKESRPNVWVETEYTIKTIALLLKINLIIWYNLKGEIVKNFNYGETKVNLIIEEYPPLKDLPNEIQNAIRNSGYQYRVTTSHYSATKILDIGIDKKDSYLEIKTGKIWNIIKEEGEGNKKIFTLENNNDQLEVDKIWLNRDFTSNINLLKNINKELMELSKELQETQENFVTTEDTKPNEKKIVSLHLKAKEPKSYVTLF